MKRMLWITAILVVGLLLGARLWLNSPYGMHWACTKATEALQAVAPGAVFGAGRFRTDMVNRMEWEDVRISGLVSGAPNAVLHLNKLRFDFAPTVLWTGKVQGLVWAGGTHHTLKGKIPVPGEDSQALELNLRGNWVPIAQLCEDLFWGQWDLPETFTRLSGRTA
ncbi:MAG: hypothetical protein JW937_03855, partial [Candidatus Omnitrophica bacterium]|nr:hypothetical protein [Candidatus Omnitrophota bacterium]